MDSLSFGFEEILLVGLLVLILFGPKGVGGIMREAGRMVGKLKKYRDEFSRELMAMSEPVRTEAEIRDTERKRIRKSCRHSLNELSPEAREKENREIRERLYALPEYGSAKRLFCYVSLPVEADTRVILNDALAQGKEVFVPACEPSSKSLKLARVRNPETDLKPGTLNICEPGVELIEPVDPLSLDFFIIPGIAFDHDCNRLGRGAGYFDRFLKGIKGKKPIVALAHNVQTYPYSIPACEHDIRPDKVLTPFALIEDKACNQSATKAPAATTPSGASTPTA